MSVAVQDHYANQKTDVDELIKTHSDLVRKIAWQIHGRTRHTTEIEDVMQIGFTGLVNAAQQYTRREGATFATYASIRIKGAIIDFLRKSSNLCRTTIQIKKKIQ
jgi:RNA polymerase sigma factor for flagellar operon FliA